MAQRSGRFRVYRVVPSVPHLNLQAVDELTLYTVYESGYETIQESVDTLRTGDLIEATIHRQTLTRHPPLGLAVSNLERGFLMVHSFQIFSLARFRLNQCYSLCLGLMIRLSPHYSSIPPAQAPTTMRYHLALFCYSPSLIRIFESDFISSMTAQLSLILTSIPDHHLIHMRCNQPDYNFLPGKLISFKP